MKRLIHGKGFLYFRNMRIFLTISASLIICDRLAAPRAACAVAKRLRREHRHPAGRPSSMGNVTVL
jgi:hypothetical protein